MQLTRQQRAQHIATAELADIDRDITIVAEDRARHKLCGAGCARWANDTAAISELLAHRLKVQDWRDTLTLEQAWA